MGALKFNPNMSTIVGRGRDSILENNGNWVKLPKNNIEIIKKIVDNGVKESEIVSLFSNRSDADYIIKIIDKLKSISALYIEEEDITPSLQNIQWAITNRCNLNCVHCCQDAGYEGDSREINDSLSLSEMKKIVDVLSKIDSLETISITGGEPLLNPYCEELTTYIRKKFKGKIILMTNGILINSRNIEWIATNFDHVSLSIDGSCAELTKMVRKKDVFDLVLSKIELLQGNKFEDISLSAILPDANEVIQEFEQLCNSYSVDPIVRSYSMSGRGQLGYEILKEGFDKYIERNGYEKKETVEEQVISGLNRCSAGVTQLTIETDGSIQPCAVLWEDEFTLGNIRKLDVDGLLAYINKENIFNFKNSDCRECEYKSFCWHCYDEYMYYIQDEDIFEKRCAVRMKRIEAILWG